MTKIGVVLPNWVGDVAMATPALRALQKRFASSASIVGVMRCYVADVLAGTTFFDETISYPANGGALRRTYILAHQLRRQRFDHVLLLTNSFSTALAARFSGTREITGYRTREGRGWLLTNGVRQQHEGWRREPLSAVDYYLRLVEAIGCPTGARQLELATLPADERAADQVWERGALDPANTVVLNTGGAYGAAKRWPNAHFATLAQLIVKQLGAPVLVLCGPAERDAAHDIVEQANHPRIVSLASANLGIGLTKACVRRSRLMVTTDSGPRHFAAAFQVPTVTLFGPTDPRWSFNYHRQSIELREELPCSPCAKRTCPLHHHQCMVDLTPQRVFAAVCKLWDEEHRAESREQRAREVA